MLSDVEEPERVPRFRWSQTRHVRLDLLLVERRRPSPHFNYLLGAKRRTLGCMAAIGQSAIYDDLLDLLSDGVEPKRLLGFRLSEPQQARLDLLLEKSREGTLAAEEGITPEGRATVELLRLNSYERMAERAELIRAGRFSGPPDH